MNVVVVLSGGLDSAVNLAWAHQEHEVCQAITFDYGQRAGKREIEQSAKLCKHYGVPHQVISLPFLAAWTKTALVEKKEELPKLSLNALDDQVKTRHSAKAVWVPNRNGIFINIAAGLAESLHADGIVVGFNKEEGTTFPDNSQPFVKALNESLFYSTWNHVQVLCRTLDCTKNEIVKLGLELGLPFSLIWSCYMGGEVMCGECESCLRLKRAVQSQAPKLLEVLSFAH
jgi:7-cyano-7-deazaguanine synthase